MAFFKCLLSGNVTEFKLEHDILEMRKHPEYIEVEPQEEVVEDEKVVTKKGK